MFGMSLEKLVLVMLIAAVLIGPTRLPDYARRLSAFTRSARGRWDAATTQFEQETGLTRDQWNPDEWRRYDPREIVRSALRDAPAEIDPPTPVAETPRPAAAADESVSAAASDAPTPADPWAEVLSAPETLARIRPGQRFIVVGSSAHPTRIALDALPELHPARLAAAVVDPEEPELPAAPAADAERNDTAEKTASVGVAA
ncbi:preprotein translocase [Microbacterium sp. IEGM 1404]|uniref:preprotein translocase n=1 Tax=Microbacterium sp. IEGM 1404 TaxID=3047084 RepID=UPI0024B68168|nr:preprotein translocase [Microbacterium sp. IEGM 1404]MDI9889651.1 preprotein translocase [Microbacterium sp. IEGM 1404]